MQQNDPSTLSRLYRVIYPKFRAHVLQNRGSEEQAKDVFQEAFIACWKNVQEQRLNPDSNMEAYLLTVAKNKWTDHLRSAYTRNRVSADSTLLVVASSSEEDPMEELVTERLNRMKLALGRLGETCRQLLMLFYFERKSMDEIAEQVGLTPASTRNQKYRCMERLRNSTLESAER